MFFKITPTSGQSLYLQLMQQIRHAVESGALRDGDQLPGIRTLAQELVVSPNTIAKAYSELEHEGLLELRQGSGAFISVNRRARSLSNHIQAATRSVAIWSNSSVKEIFAMKRFAECSKRLCFISPRR